jgi:polyhydroxyalkanoate synthesis regulator phasin
MELTQEHFDKVMSNLVTKDDVKDFATKTDIETITKRIDDLPNHSDLLGLATKTDIADLKIVLDRIDVRTDQDTRAVIKDVEKLDKRFSTLERLVKKPA